MRFRFAGMTQDKSAGLGENFLAVIILHDYMKGAMKGNEMFLFGSNVPVNFPAITCGHDMIVNRRHNQCWHSYLGKFGSQGWQKL
jgi:hypothetical protein